MVSRYISLCILLVVSHCTLADLSASVSAKRLIEGDTLVLTLTDTDNSGDEPDLSPLLKDFEVLSRSSSQNVSIINGRRQGQRQWLITLFPRNIGTLNIPALGRGNHQSQAIALEVKPAPKNQSVPTAQSPLVESSIDRDSVLVGGQILLTVSIKHLGNLVSPSLNAPEVENATVTHVHDVNFQRVIQGQTVAIIERVYAIHPEKVGTLDIPGQLFQAHVATGGQSFFGSRNTKQVIRKSPAHSLEVKPLPTFAQDKETVTANALTIEQQWSPALKDLQVGDSVTRSLVIKTQGASSAAIPPIFETQVAGIKQYQDQPVLEDSNSAEGVNGIRKQSTAYVMTEAGDFELPPIVLYWVNAETGKVQSASLPSTYFSVAAGDSTQQQARPASDSNPTIGLSNTTLPDQQSVKNHYQSQPIWFWSTIAFAALWLLTAIAWLLHNQKTQVAEPVNSTNSDDEPMLFSALIKACRHDDAVATLHAFNCWGRGLSKGLQSNQDICRYLNQPQITKAIERADRHSFEANADNTWHGKPLIQHLESARTIFCSKTTKSLQDIYP